MSWRALGSGWGRPKHAQTRDIVVTFVSGCHLLLLAHWHHTKPRRILPEAQASNIQVLLTRLVARVSGKAEGHGQPGHEGNFKLKTHWLNTSEQPLTRPRHPRLPPSSVTPALPAMSRGSSSPPCVSCTWRLHGSRFIIRAYRSQRYHNPSRWRFRNGRLSRSYWHRWCF